MPRPELILRQDFEIAFLLAMGKTQKKVSEIVGITEKTVYNILAKPEREMEITRLKKWMEIHRLSLEQRVQELTTKEYKEKRTKLSGKAYTAFDRILSSEDESILVRGIQMYEHGEFGTPKQTVRHEGEIEHKVMRLVPESLVMRVYGRHETPQVTDGSERIPEIIQEAEEVAHAE